jgi:hypothetical protein
MKLKWYKGTVIGLLILFGVIGWLSVPAPDLMIRPFLFAPEVQIEVYNYISGLTTEIAPLFLLAIIILNQFFTTRINDDDRVNNWIKKSTKDIRIFTYAISIYQTKEVFDYIFFYNMAPKWLDYSWYLLWWEFFPFALILLIAAWKSRIYENDK